MTSSDHNGPNTLSHASVHFQGLSFLQKVMKRVQCSRQIGQELAIIVKRSQIRLQLCDVGRTLGSHDCIHLLREGTNAILVNPVSERPDWKKMHFAGFNLMPCSCKRPKTSSRIAKCFSGEPPEIRISSKWQTVNLTPCRS